MSFSRSERANLDLCDLFELMSRKRSYDQCCYETYTNIIFQFILRPLTLNDL